MKKMLLGLLLIGSTASAAEVAANFVPLYEVEFRGSDGLPGVKSIYVKLTDFAKAGNLTYKNDFGVVTIASKDTAVTFGNSPDNFLVNGKTQPLSGKFIAIEDSPAVFFADAFAPFNIKYKSSEGKRVKLIPYFSSEEF